MKKKCKKQKETTFLKEEQEEEVSDYVKELLKPENLAGEFTDTEEMIRSMLED